jgi:lipoate-protein ligase A
MEVPVYAWYLLDEQTPRSGAANMAVDQLLLEAVEAGTLDRPVLRIYGWSKATLSLGYHQKWEKTVVTDALKAHDVALVRRWTGGRAVLHDPDEVTYSVIAPIQLPFKPNVSHNYKLLGTALEAFTDLQDQVESAAVPVAVGAQMVPCEGKGTRQREKLNASPCFASLSEYEIERGGKKMIGSAQKLSKQGFLQHGSMPMTARTEVLQAITGSDLDMSQLMTSLSDHWRGFGLAEPTREVIAQRLVKAFETKLGISFSALPAVVLSEEGVTSRVEERFGKPEWTYRK